MGARATSIYAGELPRKPLERMRSVYQSYFSTKFLLKSKTALGRALVSPDLSWT
jgi:hypothetical protein